MLIEPELSEIQLTKLTMVCSSKSPILFASTLSLWMLQLSIPELEKFLPRFSLTRNSVEFAIPLTQMINFFVGGVCFTLAYCLLASRSGGKLSLAENLLYLAAGFMVTTGHGIHTVCVILGPKISHLPEVDSLVDFLHEVVSHNMFVVGFFLLMVLVMAVEKTQFHYMHMLEKNAHYKSQVPNGNEHVPNGTRHVPNGTVQTMSTTKRVLLQWGFPSLFGIHSSIFSTMTGTEAVTVLFYIIIYMRFFSTYQELGLQRLLKAMDSDLQVFGSIAKAACIGLPILLAIKLIIIH